MEILSLGLLKRARRDSGTTIDDAAKCIGKSRSTMWRIESGLADISVSNLSKLLYLYNVSIIDVFIRIAEKGAYYQ